MQVATRKEGVALARKRGVPYFETSAKTGTAWTTPSWLSCCVGWNRRIASTAWCYDDGGGAGGGAGDGCGMWLPDPVRFGLINDAGGTQHSETVRRRLVLPLPFAGQLTHAFLRYCFAAAALGVGCALTRMPATTATTFL